MKILVQFDWLLKGGNNVMTAWCIKCPIIHHNYADGWLV